MTKLSEIQGLWTIDARLVPAIRAFLADDLNFDYPREFLDWAGQHIPSVWNEAVAGVFHLGVTEDSFPDRCEITEQRALCVKFAVIMDMEREREFNGDALNSMRTFPLDGKRLSFSHDIYAAWPWGRIRILAGTEIVLRAGRSIPPESDFKYWVELPDNYHDPASRHDVKILQEQWGLAVRLADLE